MKINKVASLIIIAFAICTVSSCSSEDGADGTNGVDGIDGIDGINGADGQNGTDGQNGVGFDELARFGSVSMVLDGTRPDAVDFRDSTVFKFTTVNSAILGNSNVVAITENGDDLDYLMAFRRYLSTPDDALQSSSIDIVINAKNVGEENQEIVIAVLNINDYAVVGDDNKFFSIQDSYLLDNPGVQEFEFSDMIFEQEKNQLTFSYRLIVDENNNDSNNTLEISGAVDVILLEEIP